MEIFFSNTVQNNFITLDENETRHCIQAMRYNVGDEINITNGEGKLWKGEIAVIEKKSCTVSIIEEQFFSKSNFHLHLAVAVVKHADRWEWLIEKLTELGVDEITPLISHRTEKSKINYERLNKLMLSAMKQSSGVWLPKINEVISLKDFFKKNDDSNSQKLICHNENGVTDNINKVYQKGKNVLVLIGPEGGFSEDEITLAKEKNYTPVLLGNKRLRVETAGIAACVAVQLLNS